MFFREQYKPIPLLYNLVLAMLWRHPENVQLEKVKVVHYCAAVRGLPSLVDSACAVILVCVLTNG